MGSRLTVTWASFLSTLGCIPSVLMNLYMSSWLKCSVFTVATVTLPQPLLLRVNLTNEKAKQNKIIKGKKGIERLIFFHAFCQ